MPEISITIIGLGALGNTLAEACLQASVPLSSVVTSNQEKAEYFSDHNISTFRSIEELAIEPDSLFFIAVPDDLIKDVVARIAMLGEEQSFSERVIFSHCSGAITSDVLEPLRKKGASVAAFHPLQTFSLTTGGERFHNIFISIEGDKTSLHELKILAEKVGASPLILSKKQKQSLHASAVFASNYFVAVMHAAESIALNAGIDDPMQKLKPLIEQTMKNVFTGGPQDALSGPVQRGDLLTIEGHLNLLESEKDAKEFYISSGLYVISMLENQQGIESDKIGFLKNLFKDEQKKQDK